MKYKTSFFLFLLLAFFSCKQEISTTNLPSVESTTKPWTRWWWLGNAVDESSIDATLEAFAKSMIYDINNDGFASIESFLTYAQGASVAPASIFVHLSGLTSEDGHYSDPSFDVREAATPCAIFSYLVHIIRDFEKDQFDNLNYVADELVIQNGLSRIDLKEIANGAIIPKGFRSLIKQYMDLAEDYRLRTVEVIKSITPLLDPKYQLSLHIIYNLYLMVYERIDVEKGNFTTEELNPTSAEIKERVYRTIMKFEL